MPLNTTRTRQTIKTGRSLHPTLEVHHRHSPCLSRGCAGCLARVGHLVSRRIQASVFARSIRVPSTQPCPTHVDNAGLAVIQGRALAYRTRTQCAHPGRAVTRPCRIPRRDRHGLALLPSRGTYFPTRPCSPARPTRVERTGPIKAREHRSSRATNFTPRFVVRHVRIRSAPATPGLFLCPEEEWQKTCHAPSVAQ